MKDEEIVEFLLTVMKAIFTDVVQNSVLPNEEQLKVLEELEKSVEYYQDAVVFLKHLDSAINPMIELIESATIGDMQEAVKFFVAAYQFKVERANEGIYGEL